MLKLLLPVFLFTVYVVLCDQATEDDVANDIERDEGKKPALPPGAQSMSFSQPDLSEEEQKSHHFPGRYRCEACQIVVHNLGTDFQTAESKIPKKKKRKVLGDIDILETVENVCEKEKFDPYSIQEFNGKVMFKGPAFPDRTAAGMSMGGGFWPVRYKNYCGSLFEEYAEDEVYDFYRQGNLFYELCLKRHCRDAMTTTPKAVDFRHTLADDEDICRQNGSGKTCSNNKKGKDEL